MADSCFNPCYAGSKIERLVSLPIQVNIICFNPCYAGSKIERTMFVEDGEVDMVFQSLLCWK